MDDESTFKEAAKSVKDILKGKGLTVLINNAGIYHKKGLADVDDENMTTSFRVNATAPLLLTKVKFYIF